MRILFLTHRHSDLTIGGLAEFLMLLPRYLIPCGVESYIYTQASAKNITALQGPFILSNEAKHYCGPFLKPSWLPRSHELKPLLELCLAEKIDLVHAQGTYRAGYMAYALHKKINLPYIVTSHSDILTSNSARIQRRSILKRCATVLKHAAFVTHLTPQMANASHAIYNTAEKSAIVHNGIDISTYQVESKSTTPYFLAIGRLVTEKGFLVLLVAFLQLHQSGSDASFVIAGTGILETTLMERAKRAGVNVVTGWSDSNPIPKRSVIFTQYVRAELKAQLYAGAACVLFAPQPTIWEEAFGIVQLEAMAAKKPLIVSDIGVTRYLEQLGMCAQFVKADDSSAWFQAMQTILQDETLRVKMSENNTQAIQQFDWQAIAKSYATIYNRLATHFIST